MSASAMPRRLGRGLASLMGDPTPVQSKLPAEGEQRVVPVDQIRPCPLNPRRDFREEELEDLTNSIRQKGLVQPLIVRPSMLGGQVGYEIVAGERRWRASQRAGLHSIPVIVRDLSDQQLLEFAIIENVQRADLNPLEEARGYRDLIERYGYTQESVSDVIGKSRSHLANTLRLLKLPAVVQEMVETGRLTAGHARALVGRDDAEALAHRIVERGLNVRDVEALVQTADMKVAAGDIKSPPNKDADTRAFELELAGALGLKVEIRKGSGESGVLTIKYSNYDQLDYLRRRIMGTPH